MSSEPAYNEKYQDWSGYEKSKYYHWRTPMPAFMQDLMDAIDDSDHETVQSILDEHGDEVEWMARDSQWHSMLNMAVKRNDLKMVDLLLDYGALIEWSGSESFDKLRPLSNAIWWGHNDIAHRLIDRGADIDGDGPKYGVDTQRGWTGVPITIAHARGNVEMVDRLLRSGARSGIWNEHEEEIPVVPLDGESLVDAYVRIREETYGSMLNSSDEDEQCVDDDE